MKAVVADHIQLVAGCTSDPRRVQLKHYLEMILLIHAHRCGERERERERERCTHVISVANSKCFYVGHQSFVTRAILTVFGIVRGRTYGMITYVSTENNLGPDDKIRYIWGL